MKIKIIVLQDVTPCSLTDGTNVSEKPVAYILRLKWRKQNAETLLQLRERQTLP